MPVCDICGEVVSKVFTCAECGAKFCRDCGDSEPKSKVCAFCTLNTKRC